MELEKILHKPIEVNLLCKEMEELQKESKHEGYNDCREF